MELVINLQSVCVDVPAKAAIKAIETGDFWEINQAVQKAIQKRWAEGDPLIESVEEL